MNSAFGTQSFNFHNNDASSTNYTYSLKNIVCTEFYDEQIIFYDIFNKNS